MWGFKNLYYILRSSKKTQNQFHWFCNLFRDQCTSFCSVATLKISHSWISVTFRCFSLTDTSVHLMKSTGSESPACPGSKPAIDSRLLKVLNPTVDLFRTSPWKRQTHSSSGCPRGFRTYASHNSAQIPQKASWSVWPAQPRCSERSPRAQENHQPSCPNVHDKNIPRKQPGTDSTFTSLRLQTCTDRLAQFVHRYSQRWGRESRIGA